MNFEKIVIHLHIIGFPLGVIPSQGLTMEVHMPVLQGHTLFSGSIHIYLCMHKIHTLSFKLTFPLLTTCWCKHWHSSLISTLRQWKETQRIIQPLKLYVVQGTFLLHKNRSDINVFRNASPCYLKQRLPQPYELHDVLLLQSRPVQVV